MNKENASEKKVFIDLRKVFHDKSPRLAPYIPGFVYNYLNRVLHLKEINNILALHGSKIGLAFTEEVIKEYNVTTSLKGEEHLPENGRFVFVSNHPLGGFDGILLLTILGRRYDDVRSLSNDILMNFDNLKPLFIPINKHGTMTQESLRLLDEAMESEMQILTFPSGLVSRKIKGKIIDPPWKKSFISKAVQHKRDIIPIHISGRCSNFFYGLSNFRKFLGIKANLEMFYLSDETHKHRNEHITITFGPMISYKTFDKSKKTEDWAKMMQNYVYTLGEGNTKPFNPNI